MQQLNRLKMTQNVGKNGQTPLDLKPDINDIPQLGFPEIKLPAQ
jgi:hypothetical protein